MPSAGSKFMNGLCPSPVSHRATLAATALSASLWLTKILIGSGPWESPGVGLRQCLGITLGACAPPFDRLLRRACGQGLGLGTRCSAWTPATGRRLADTTA